MVGRIAAGIAADDHVVAGLECVLLNALTAQLAGSAPLSGPDNGLPLLVGGFHQNNGMRIAEEKLNNPAFNLDRLLRIGLGKRVVCRDVTAGKQRGADEQRPQPELRQSGHCRIILEMRVAS